MGELLEAESEQRNKCQDELLLGLEGVPLGFPDVEDI